MSPRTWALAGAALGGALGLATQVPAAWLAHTMDRASDGHVLLADARGTLWSGSALAVLAAGPGGRDAAVLPGRLQWQLRWTFQGGPALELLARQACCLNGTLRLRVEGGWSRWRVVLPAAPQTMLVGQWPAAWLAGLGTPWNTMQLGGTLRLASPGLVIERVQGRWRVEGRADLELAQVSSRLTTLPELGSYRLTLSGTGDAPARLALDTLAGELQLGGSGEWGAQLRFRGQARAAEGAEAALDNLLNIIGRRQGAVAVIAIG